MIEGPVAVPEGRLAELVDLTNRVFRAHGGDMGSEYPLVFDPDSPDGMRVMIADGRIVSHVGVCVRDAVILGAPVRVASVGAVCTDPAHRKQNLAGSLMEDAIEWARERNADLMLISGDRSLYRRMGAARAGRFQFLEVAGGEMPRGRSLAKAEESDIPALASLYQREPVRFVRPYEDWQRLLSAGMLMNRRADCWIVRDEEETLAYVAAQRPDSHSTGETRPRVMEYGGSREAVWQALAALAVEYGASTTRTVVMPGDLDLPGRARRAELPVHEGGFSGTVRVLDAAELFSLFEELWVERYGERHVASLKLVADRDQISYVAHGARVVLQGPAATTAFFGAEPGQQTESSTLPGLEPLPLLWYGYNYV